MTVKRIDGYIKGQPDVAWWKRQITAGILYRKKYADEARWMQWRQFYRGYFPTNILPVNLYFRMLRTLVPRTYFRNPSISVQATKPGYEQQVFAQLVERTDNKLIRTMGVKNQIKKAIQNTWMFGTGACKLGFGAQFTPSPGDFETDAPEHMTGGLTRRVEYNSLVQPNMPWFMSVHPGNLIVPDGLMGWEETPWVAMRAVRSKDDVLADPRLTVKSGTALASAGSASLQSSGDRPSVGGRAVTQGSRNEVELYEIRDMRTGKVIVIAPYSDSNNALMFEDDLMQTNSRPNIYPIIFNPDDEVFWGIPDSRILEPQQLEINEIRTLMMKHRRISIVKLLYKSGALDNSELEKLVSSDVAAAVRINKEFDVTDLEKFELGHIPESLFAADQTIMGDVREGQGFSRNSAGEYASNKSHNAPTAAEAQIVSEASEIRTDERKDVVADMLVDIFEDANVLCFEEWTDDQVVQVMGPDQIPLWVAFKPNMLKAARYELSIDPDSTVPETKNVRRQKADILYEKLKLNPLVDPIMLTKWYMREQGGVALDTMLLAMQQNAAQGVPGATPESPMGVEDFMGMMSKRPPGQQ